MNLDTTTLTLESTKIDGLPDTVYYVPNFITEAEERMILDKIEAAPKPRWKQLTHRRLQTWPSDLVQNKLLDAPLPAWLETPVISRLASMTLSESDSSHIFAASPHQKPNHVLINEYPPGIGIMPHKLSTRFAVSCPDGSAYWPVVCTVSLGASLCLNLYRAGDDGVTEVEPCWRILQEPRSLLITTGSLYEDYLHGIADIEQDIELSEQSVANWNQLGDTKVFENGVNIRTTRTSLTYRDVIKVSKAASKLGMFIKR